MAEGLKRVELRGRVVEGDIDGGVKGGVASGCEISRILPIGCCGFCAERIDCEVPTPNDFL